MKHFLFNQIDSWFFRESRSMDGAGSTALESIFPPQNNTLMGAIRTQIGNCYHQKHNSDWKSFNPQHPLANIIGFGTDYANLQAQGAWLYHNEEEQLYFPCPLNLLKQADKTDFFSLGKAVLCDLGKVQLPQLDREKAQTSIENAYISETAFSQILAGKRPLYREVLEKVVVEDPRLGIARDNPSHRVLDGKLYQTNHLRLDPKLSVYLGVSGIDEDYLPKETLLRLGGEARMANLNTLSQAVTLPQKLTNISNNELVIYLATPLPDFKREQGLPMLPNSSFKKQENDVTTWVGEILGQKIEVISAITAKPQRMGGWDMVKHQSTPVRSFIPAGCCWYIKTDNPQAVIDTLHGNYLTDGNDKALGYGQMFVGIAPKTN